MGGFAEKNGRAGSPLPADSLAETAWPMVRLGDVCEVRAGATHHGIMSKTGKYPAYGSGGYICQVSEYRCPANTVTVGRKGTLDKPLLIEEPFWNIDTCFGVIPSGKVNPRYLWRFCQSFDFYALVPTIGRPSTNSDAIKEILLPLPPLSVQREIVERLEKELGEAEKVAAGFRRIAEKAEAEFKAELDETFKALEDDVSRGGAETRRVRLGDVCEMSLGKMLDRNKNKGKERPYLRNVNVRWGAFLLNDLLEMRFEEDELERYSIKKGDLVVCEGGEPGRCAIWQENCPILFQKALHRLRTSSKLSAEYLFYIFKLYAQDGTFKRYHSGTTIMHLTGQVLREIEIPLPPLSAQHTIVSQLDAARERCNKIKAEAEKGLKAAENLRKAILKEAFEQ